MYFSDEQHKSNFDFIVNKYLFRKDDNQYKSSFYIAAYPGIFDAIDFDNFNTESSPLFSLMSWNEKEEKHEVSSPELTGSTRRLLEVGLSLYNGYSISLDEVIGSLASEELFNVFIQACKIRARK